MSSLGKRARNASISPPPLRGKQLGHTSPTILPTSPNLLRVFSWNVNGIGPLIQKPIISFFDPKTTSSSPLRSFLQRHQWPQLLCLQEVKIAPKDDTTKRLVERAANGYGAADDGPSYSTFFSLPRDKYNAKGFGGKVCGVATLVRDDCATISSREVSWDREGRVLTTELEAKIVVINGYWVNGTDFPYKDSETGQVAGTRHDRKRGFHQLMLDETLGLQSRGYHVILAGDMNISRGPLDGHPNIRMGSCHVENREDFNTKFFLSKGGMRGIDTFRHVHGEKRKYTYYSHARIWGNRCNRIDLIIASQSLVEEDGVLVEADILDSPQERGHSDHVPLYVTIDTQKITSRENREPV